MLSIYISKEKLNQLSELPYSVFLQMQLGSKLINLTDKADESESRKRQLQDMVDGLNADLANLRTNEQLLTGIGAASEEICANQLDIREKLNEEFRRQREHYIQQVKQLRDEIDAKDRKTEDMKELVLFFLMFM